MATRSLKLATLLTLANNVPWTLAFSPVRPSGFQQRNPFALASTTEDTEAAATNDAQLIDLNPRELGLALMLDDGTRKSHSMAQNSAFVSGFFKGIATKTAFSKLVTSLYFVYSTMEQAFDQTNNGSVKSLDDPELRRVPSLEKDMEYFYGYNWKTLVSESPATRLYVARVKEVAEKEPYLLVAHQYTRYLGDLFGGQMMGGMAIRSLGLEAKQGVAFYNFDEIPSTFDFITSWYGRLNKLELTEEQRQAIVDEANLVFDLNIGILEELDGSPLRAMFLLTVNTLKLKFGVK